MAFESNPIVVPCLKPNARNLMHPYVSKNSVQCILQATSSLVEFNMQVPALSVHEHISNDFLYLVVRYCVCSGESASHAHGHLRLEACIKSKSYCHTTLEERATTSKGNIHYSFSQVFHPQALAL